jgi:hypothetical protein
MDKFLSVIQRGDLRAVAALPRADDPQAVWTLCLVSVTFLLLLLLLLLLALCRRKAGPFWRRFY